jgi:hypothetical protein
MYDKLNLRRWVFGSFVPFLEREKPGLAERLSALVGAKSDYWRGICSMIRKLCEEQSVRCEPAFPS